MANWDILKSAIANAIKTNGNQEITGQLLQNVLNNIVSSVGENATFAGIATPTTNPGNPDGPVFYLAVQSGQYANFGSINLYRSGLTALYNQGDIWRSASVWSSVDYMTSELNSCLFDFGKGFNPVVLNGAIAGENSFTIPTGQSGTSSYISSWVNDPGVINLINEAREHQCKMRLLTKCTINDVSYKQYYFGVNKQGGESVSREYSHVEVSGNDIFSDIIADIPVNVTSIQAFIQVHGTTPVSSDIVVKAVAFALIFVEGEAEAYNRKLQELSLEYRFNRSVEQNEIVNAENFNTYVEENQFVDTTHVAEALKSYFTINEDEPFGCVSAGIKAQAVQINASKRTMTVPANSGVLDSASYLILNFRDELLLRGINDYKLPLLWAFKIKTNGSIDNFGIVLNSYFTDGSSTTRQSRDFKDMGGGIYYIYGVRQFGQDGKVLSQVEMALLRNQAKTSSEQEVTVLENYSISFASGSQSEILNREIANKLLQANANKGHSHSCISPSSIGNYPQGSVVKGEAENSMKIPANAALAGSYFEARFPQTIIDTFNKYGVDKFQVIFEIEMPEWAEVSLFARVNGQTTISAPLVDEWSNGIKRTVLRVRFNNNRDISSIYAFAQFYGTSIEEASIALKTIKLLPLTDTALQAYGIYEHEELIKEGIAKIDNTVENLPGKFIGVRHDRFWSLQAGGDVYGVTLRFDLFSGLEGGVLPVGKTLFLQYRIKEEKNESMDLIRFSRYNYYRANSETVTLYPTIALLESDERYNYYSVQFKIPITEKLSTIDGVFQIALMSNQHIVVATNWNLEIYDLVVGFPETSEVHLTLLRDKLHKIDEAISKVNEKIGQPYYISGKDPLQSITALPGEGVSIRSNGLGLTIPAGVSELGNALRMHFQYGQYSDIRNSALDIRLGFNGDSTNTFSAKVYTAKGVFMGDADWYWDYNNGMIRVNVPINKYKSLDSIEVRVECTSESANGFDLFYITALVEGRNEVQSIASRLSALESAEAPLIITSNSGKKFRLVVDDSGNLSTANFYFSKILVLSHSFGSHPPSLGIGWNGNWGMAASKESEDFVHKLIGLMQTVNPDVSLTAVKSLQPFEVGHTKQDFNYSQFDYLNDLDFDCVVIKIGENSTYSTDYGEHLIKLLSEHIIRNKPCKVFIASMWYSSTDTADYLTGLNAEFKKVADYYQTKVVMINDSSRPNTAWDYPLPALPNGSQPDKGVYPNGWGTADVTADNGRVISAVVGGHPGDYGHTVIANAFWARIKTEYGISE